MPETHDVDETRPVRTADPERQPEVPTDDSDRSVADYEASDERPGPDHPGKVEKPTDLKRPSVLLAVRRSVREFLDDGCTDLAAALTYYSVLAIFPALLALLSLVGVVGQAAGVGRRSSRSCSRWSPPKRLETHQGAPRRSWPTARAPASRWSSVSSAPSGRPRATSAPSAGR